MSIEEKNIYKDIYASVGSFLDNEGFSQSLSLQNGVVSIINQISRYLEEGKELYPSIIISNDIESIVHSFASRHLLIIGSDENVDSSYLKALRLCAPLSKDGWVVFIEYSDDSIKYGLFSVEISALSPSFSQLVSLGVSYYPSVNFIFISNGGKNIVSIKGIKHSLIINLNLKESNSRQMDYCYNLCTFITKDIPPDFSHTCLQFIHKQILNALQDCHGALIGVIEDTVKIGDVKALFGDGVYLLYPIDVVERLTIGDDSVLRSIASIIRNMISFDGITVFTSSGKIVCYHLFISINEREENSAKGSRYRAFESMISSSYFISAFYKSQDGEEKFWSK